MNSRDYLSFTKKERIGILVLITLVLLVAILPRYLKQEPPVSEFEYEKISSQLSGDSGHQPHYEPAKTQPGQERVTTNDNRHARGKPNNKSPGKKNIIEINAADTTAFISLPGIGSKLASRIVLFRDKLGGFVTVDQIREIYGLKDSVVQIILPYLKCDTSLIRKIDINTATKEELQVHPYIRWKIADAIITYRKQHGSFSSPVDIYKMYSVDSTAIKKIVPYLLFK